MNKFAEYVLRFRLSIIIATILTTLFFAYQLKDLTVNSDIITYLKPDDPAVVLFNRIGKEYAGSAMAMVGIEAEDVFENSTLNTIDALTEKFKQIDGVVSVMSLTDILDIKSVEGGMEVGRLIDKNNIPTDPEELRQIRSYALSKDMYNGRVVSPDGKITIIIARMQQQSDKPSIAAKIKSIALKEAIGYKLYFSGMPMQMLEVNDIIINDMLWLVPIVALMLVLVLYASFRSKRGVILPLLTVFISVVWAMGLMTLLGIELSMISNIMPVVLIAVGSAYGIHMIARYNEDIHDCQDSKACIKISLAKVGIPIILAGVTTLIGFMSFTGAYLTAVTHFGVFTGIGVAFALIVSITFIPAVLTYLKIPRIKRTEQGKEDNFLVHTLDKVAAFVLQREKWIVFGSAVILIIALIGLPHLKRQANMMEYFHDDTDIRLAEKMMQDNFGGSVPIQIVVNGDLKNPFILKQIRKLEKFLETVPYVGSPQSIADLICEMNKVMNGHYTIPDSREGVANLWFFIEGESVMEQLVNAKANEGIIQANLGTMDTKYINEVVNAIDDYIYKNTSEPFFTITGIQINQQRELNDYLTSSIAGNILLDASKYQIKGRIDTLKLKEKISQIQMIMSVVYSNSLLNKIESHLEDFFLYESEIEIEDERRIKQINRAVISSLQQKTLPDEAELRNIIINNIPKNIASDTEGVTETIHSLGIILNEYYQYEKIMTGVDMLLPLFPKELRNKQKFYYELRDDLWALNENNFIVPESLTKKHDIEGETVTIDLNQTGMPLIFTHMDDSLVKSQLQSLIIAIILVALLLVIQLRSIIGGLIAVSPIVLTVLLNFSLMSYLNVPLDIATILVSSIAIGIGIDYTIHFTSRFKEEFARDKSELEALDKTLNSTGRAILINALSVAMGFIVLMFAQLIPIQRFGWLTATTMIFSAAGAISFLPALILLSRAKFVGDFSRFNGFLKRNNTKEKNEKIPKSQSRFL